MSEPTRESRASVRLRNGVYLVHPMACRTDRIWITDGPLQTLTLDCTDSGLGDTTTAALDTCRYDLLATPLRQAVPDPPFFKELGVRTWAAFERGSRVVSVRRTSATVELISWQLITPRRGFMVADGGRETLSTADTADFGRAIRRALDIAK